MSASYHLSEDQFRLFHGTNRKIKGDVINPTKQRGDEWDGDGPHAAFASDRPDVAGQYGEHVYEVHPTGGEEHVGTNVYLSNDGYAVKRKLKPEVVERYKRIVGPIHEANEEREHGLWMHETKSEHWSHEGEKVYHVKYDKEGSKIKTQVAKMGDRPKSNND